MSAEKGSHHTLTKRLGEAEFAQIVGFLDLKNAAERCIGAGFGYNL
jgi:hypothetical protein